MRELIGIARRGSKHLNGADAAVLGEDVKHFCTSPSKVPACNTLRRILMLGSVRRERPPRCIVYWTLTHACAQSVIGNMMFSL